MSRLNFESNHASHLRDVEYGETSILLRCFHVRPAFLRLISHTLSIHSHCLAPFSIIILDKVALLVTYLCLFRHCWISTLLINLTLECLVSRTRTQGVIS